MDAIMRDDFPAAKIKKRFVMVCQNDNKLSRKTYHSPCCDANMFAW
jgi:hypothetical protein